MPVNISQFNVPGLAALAGQSVGQMNLPIVPLQPGLYQEGLIKGDALRVEQDQKQQVINNELIIADLMQKGMDRRQATEVAAQLQAQKSQQEFYGQQNQLDRDQQMGIAKMGNKFNYDQLDATKQYQQGQLGLGAEQNAISRMSAENTGAYQKGQLGIAKEQLGLEKVKVQLEARAKLDAAEREHRGAAAAGYVYAVQQIDANRSLTPEQKAQKLEALKSSYLSNSLVKKTLSKEELSTLSQMSPVDITGVAMQDLFMTDKAGQMASLMKASANTGGTKIFDPATGNLVYESTPATEPTQNKLQDEVVNAETHLARLNSIASTYNKNFLTLGGSVKGAVGQGSSYLNSGTVDSALGAVGVDAKGAREFETKRKEFQVQLKNEMFSTIREFSGQSYTDKQLETMVDAIVSETNPASFEGKMQGQLKYLQAMTQAKQKLLKDGIAFDSPAYRKEFVSTADSIMAKIQKEESTPITYQGRIYSPSDIEAIAKDNNITPEEVRKQLGGK